MVDSLSRTLRNPSSLRQTTGIFGAATSARMTLPVFSGTLLKPPRADFPVGLETTAARISFVSPGLRRRVILDFPMELTEPTLVEIPFPLYNIVLMLLSYSCF